MGFSFVSGGGVGEEEEEIRAEFRAETVTGSAPFDTNASIDLAWSGVVYDTADALDSSGGIYTIPYDGMYNMSMRVTLSNVNEDSYRSEIRVNNDPDHVTEQSRSAGSFGRMTLITSEDDVFNAGDELSFSLAGGDAGLVDSTSGRYAALTIRRVADKPSV